MGIIQIITQRWRSMNKYCKWDYHPPSNLHKTSGFALEEMEYKIVASMRKAYLAILDLEKTFDRVPRAIICNRQIIRCNEKFFRK